MCVCVFCARRMHILCDYFSVQETLLLAASNDFASRIWALPSLRLQVGKDCKDGSLGYLSLLVTTDIPYIIRGMYMHTQ